MNADSATFIFLRGEKSPIGDILPMSSIVVFGTMSTNVDTLPLMFVYSDDWREVDEVVSSGNALQPRSREGGPGRRAS